ncbi:hypothetical protein [Corynebacterium comes]|nr:hypothetical protein [Corynebacterium comes]
MRNWGKELGFVDVRGLSDRAGHTLLTAEIAVTDELWTPLAPWEKSAARAFAVGLTMDTAVVCGKSAARLIGIELPGWEDTVEVTYPGKRKPGGQRYWPEGVRFRYRNLGEDEVVEREGIRLTAIYRTLRDIAVLHGLADGVVALDSARRRWPEVSMQTWRSGLLRGPRFKGVGTVRRVLDLSVPDSDSPQESLARIRLIIADLPGVEEIRTQVRFEADGRSYPVDLLINEWLVLEFDGDIKYEEGAFGRTTRETVLKEREREVLLLNLGLQVRRVRARDLELDADGWCPMFGIVLDALRGREELGRKIRD